MRSWRASFVALKDEGEEGKRGKGEKDKNPVLLSAEC